MALDIANVPNRTGILSIAGIIKNSDQSEPNRGTKDMEPQNINDA